MIRLDQDGRKLQALLGGAISTTALDVVVCFTDVGERDGRQFPVPVRLSRLSDTTPVDICEAATPAAAVLREVDYVSIRNNDSASATVTVRYYDAGSTFEIVSVALPTLNSLLYAGGLWHVLDADGKVLR